MTSLLFENGGINTAPLLDGGSTIGGIQDPAATLGLLGAAAPLDEADPFFADAPLVSYDSSAQQAAIDAEQEQLRQEILAVQEGIADPVATEKQSFKQQLAGSLPFLAMIATARTQEQLNRAVMGYSEVRQQAQQQAERKALREQNRRMQAASLQLRPLEARMESLSQAERDIRSHDVRIKMGNQEAQLRTNLNAADAENMFRSKGTEFQRAISLAYTKSHLDTNQMLLLEGEKLEQFRERWDHEWDMMKERIGSDEAIALAERQFRSDDQILQLSFNSIMQGQRLAQQARMQNPAMAHLIPMPDMETEIGRVVGVAEALKGKKGTGLEEAIPKMKTRSSTIAAKSTLEMTADDFTDPASGEKSKKDYESFLSSANAENPTNSFDAAEKAVRSSFEAAYQNPSLKSEHPDKADRAAMAVAYVERGLEAAYPDGVPDFLMKQLAFLQENASKPSIFEQIGQTASEIGIPLPGAIGFLPDSLGDTAVEFGYEMGRGLPQTGSATDAVQELLGRRDQQFP